MITYPALKAKMGSWDYFIVRMSMRELAESVKLAHDVHAAVKAKDALPEVPEERVYPLSDALRARLGC